MFFDKSEKRAKYYERKNPIKYRDKIARLRSNPNWYVRYWDKDGRCHEEPCPPAYQSREGAEKWEKIVRANIEKGVQVIPSIRNTTVSDMVNFFLDIRKNKSDKKEGMSGYSAAKTICKHISEEIGHVPFEACRRQPLILQKYIDSLPVNHPDWSPKYTWNICKELRAIFSTWIKRNLLQIPNPMDAIDDPDPKTAVMDYVPTHEDYEKIITTGIIEGVRADVLRLIGAVRYTGFRINEILRWDVEDCVLDPDDGLPYIWVTISKQRRPVRVPRPIRAELVKILREQIGLRSTGPVWPWKNPPYKLLRVYEWADKNGRNGYPERLRFKGWLYELAGVQVPRPFHDFRKTVKLELKRTLGDSKLARDYQGHKSESMDDWYTWFQREDLEEAVRESYTDDKWKTHRGQNRGPK